MIEWTISGFYAVMLSKFFQFLNFDVHGASAIRKYCQGRWFRANVFNELVRFEIVAFPGSISRAVFIFVHENC
jgi:hypothetical protein